MPVFCTMNCSGFKIIPNKRLLNALFKTLAVLLPAAALYLELSGKSKLGAITATFAGQWQGACGWWLSGACLLVPLNWLAEVQKWQPFVARCEPMPHRKALQAVLAGASVALFTPNRVGDYGGRILFVRPENQWKALMANVVGNTAQYLVLLTGGAAGAVWLGASVFGGGDLMRAEAVALAAVVLAGLYYFYFNIRLIAPFARRLPWLRRFGAYLRGVDMLEQFSRRDLGFVLFWSVLRYAVYSTQYFMLLQFFGITTGLTPGYAGIATIYLLQTVLPLPALAGLLVRGSLAVFVWSHFGANELSSLAATFVLWIINVILPALIGTFSLFSVNITKSLGYDDD